MENLWDCKQREDFLHIHSVERAYLMTNLRGDIKQ